MQYKPSLEASFRSSSSGQDRIKTSHLREYRNRPNRLSDVWWTVKSTMDTHLTIVFRSSLTLRPNLDGPRSPHWGVYTRPVLSVSTSGLQVREAFLR